MNKRTFQKVNILVGEMLFHPETVTLSSTGPASQKHVTSMGVYKITNMTHSGKPVWLSTIRDDRYLFFNGTHLHITT